ncbi:MAG TPA: hypothetical protein V6C65_37310, partial [Allocoleopsis sp.]
RWYQGPCFWDLSHAELRRSLREKLGLEQFFDPEREWTEYDLEACASRARELTAQIQVGLNFTIPSGTKDNGKPKMSDVQIVHQLLSQLGIKVTFRWSRSVQGHEGEKLRVYRLDANHWQQVTAILERRQKKRQSSEQKGFESMVGSPRQLHNSISQGDPAQKRSSEAEGAGSGVAKPQDFGTVNLSTIPKTEPNLAASNPTPDLSQPLF